MKMDINFYKKQTVLNDILTDTNIVIVDNSQLINSYNYAKLNKSEYLVSNTGDIQNTNYKNSTSNLTRLYISHYGIDPSKSSITNEEIIENIKRYNNFTENSSNIDELKHREYNFPQISEHNNYDYLSQTGSLLLDTTYNLLYYTQYDKVNLMAYHINQTNGFNYDNHMLYFNIDNEYICSLNNTLYYNFNKIKDASQKDKGISLINPKFFNVKNLENNYYKNNAILSLNKKFKYDLFITLNKLKNVYHNCETISDTLSYYVNIDDYNNHYLDLVNLSYKDSKLYININQKSCYNYITYITFEDTKLYYSDRTLGINSLEINSEDTLYVGKLDNADFKIGYISNATNNYDYTYINSYNMNLFKNSSSLVIDGNNINTKISYNYNYKYFSEFITSSFVETSKSVWESQVHNNIRTVTKENVIKFPITISYHINIPSTIDQTIFKNSGLNIIYKGAPYLSYLNQSTWDKIPTYVTYSSESSANSGIYVYNYWYFQNITIQLNHELDIRPLNSKAFAHSYSKKSCVETPKNSKTSENHYYILSSKNLFDIQNLSFVRLRKELGNTNELSENAGIGTTIYLQGTAYDNEQNGINGIPCKVKINNGDNLVLESSRRGLNLVAIDKKTYTIVDRANYDTYGEAANDIDKRNYGITLLKSKLKNIKNDVGIYSNHDVFICLVSFDAIGWDEELITLLQSFGMGDLPYTNTGRYPFSFIGYKNLGKGNGYMKMNNLGSYQNTAELSINMVNNTYGKIEFTIPYNFQISGLSNYNCYSCGIYLNKYLFNELYSQKLITKISDLHYYQIAPLYIENYNGEYIDNNANSHKEYIPVLNNYPTKYLNDKFFSSNIYSKDNYPVKEELDTCISNINDLWTNGYNKLYLYEIQKDGEDYYLKFYTVFSSDDLNTNISNEDINNLGGTINVSNAHILLYNNQSSNSLTNKNNLYQYLYQYLNNFISF